MCVSRQKAEGGGEGGGGGAGGWGGRSFSGMCAVLASPPGNDISYQQRGRQRKRGRKEIEGERGGVGSRGQRVCVGRGVNQVPFIYLCNFLCKRRQGGRVSFQRFAAGK